MITSGINVAPSLRRAVGVALLLLLILGLLLIVAPFLEGFVWGAILVLMTWPIYCWLHVRCRLREAVAAFLMTLGTGIVIVLVAVPVVTELGTELYTISKELNLGAQDDGSQRFSHLALDRMVRSLHFDQVYTLSMKTLSELSVSAAGQATHVLLTALFNIGVMIFSSYFFYLHGSRLLLELQSVLIRYIGLNWQRVSVLTGDTIRGVVYGTLATALAQGILAGLGYYISGAPVPALLGLVTTFMSFVPFGAPLVYLPVSLYLLFGAGDLTASIGLLIWGVLVVSTIDNIVRPIFIAQTIRLSMLLVFVGVLGGILAFGLVGLFIGPVLVALAHALWKEVVDTSTGADREGASVRFTSSANG